MLLGSLGIQTKMLMNPLKKQLFDGFNTAYNILQFLQSEILEKQKWMLLKIYSSLIFCTLFSLILNVWLISNTAWNNRTESVVIYLAKEIHNWPGNAVAGLKAVMSLILIGFVL